MTKYTYLQKLVCLTVCFSSCCVFAYGHVQESEENYEIEVTADSVVQVGKQLLLTYTYSTADSSVSVSNPKVRWDDGTCCDVLMGPTRSYRKIDGNVNNTYVYTFTYVVVFNSECDFSVPRMELETNNGKVLTSAPFTIRAVSSVQMPEMKKNIELSEDEFVVVETSVNKTQLSLGDSAECEIRLYTNVSSNRMAAKSELLIDNAFWHDIKQPDSLSVEDATYNGKPCHSVLWRKFSIIPLQAGEIQIKPMQFVITIVKYVPDVDPFEAFLNFGGRYIAKDTVLTTRPLVIHVEKKANSKRGLSFIPSNSPQRYGLLIDRSSSLLAKEGLLSLSFSESERPHLLSVPPEEEENQTFLYCICYLKKSSLRQKLNS